MTPPPRGEYLILLGLSTPVVVAQLGMMAMSVIDLMMIARVGVAELAAVTIANLLGYYVLGLPLAWIQSFQLELGVAGILWELAAGLGLVAILLLFWTLLTSPRPLE